MSGYVHDTHTSIHTTSFRPESSDSPRPFLLSSSAFFPLTIDRMSNRYGVSRVSLSTCPFFSDTHHMTAGWDIGQGWTLLLWGSYMSEEQDVQGVYEQSGMSSTFEFLWRGFFKIFVGRCVICM